MDNAINNRSFNDYQLISIAIELVQKVLSLANCKPELLEENHVLKVYELARQWNKTFYKAYISKEGE